MAEQCKNPRPWKLGQGDGCTGVFDRILWVDMTICCDSHDESYHYGGGVVQKAFADRRFRQCIRDEGCWLCKMIAMWRYAFLKNFVRKAFNWDGPSSPHFHAAIKHARDMGWKLVDIKYGDVILITVESEGEVFGMSVSDVGYFFKEAPASDPVV